MRVACIVPTYDRQALFPQLYRVFCAQLYEPKSLWIYDDTPRRSHYFDQLANLGETRVHYVHSSKRQTIGSKRNLLASMCDGDAIAHFDDDDVYHALYLPRMMARLDGHDFVKLGIWDALNQYDGSVWRWDTTRGGGPCYMVTGGEPAAWTPDCPSDAAAVDASTWGYGFSYVYTRALWKLAPFPNLNLGEDVGFIAAIRQWNPRMALVNDAPDLVLHTIHTKSTSRIYPQQCLSASYSMTRAPKQKKDKGKQMTLTAGVPVQVVALVKDSHTVQSLRERARTYGVDVEQVMDGVQGAALGLPPAKRGYRYVQARLRPVRHVTMRSSVPPPFSLYDKTAVVRVQNA